MLKAPNTAFTKSKSFRQHRINPCRSYHPILSHSGLIRPSFSHPPTISPSIKSHLNITLNRSFITRTNLYENLYELYSHKFKPDLKHLNIINQLKNTYIRHNINNQHMIGIVSRNSNEIAAIMLAAFSLGIPVVPIYANAKEEEILAIVENTNFRMLFVQDETLFTTLNPHVSKMEHVKLYSLHANSDHPNSFENLIRNTDIHDDVVQTVSGNDVALVFYASDSNGRIENQSLTHNQVIQNLENLQDLWHGSIHHFVGFCLLPWPHMQSFTDGFIKMMDSTFSNKPLKRVQHILDQKHQTDFSVPHDLSVMDTISFLSERDISAAIVIGDDSNLAGIVTAREILRYLHEFRTNHQHRLTSDIPYDLKELNHPICQLMTPKEKVVYCSPSDSIKHCREIMFQLKIRHLPVITRNEVLGIVTIEDLADSSFSLTDVGGKKGFIHNVLGRKGVPDGIRYTAVQQQERAVKKKKIPLALEYGAFALPHPFKAATGVAPSMRDHSSKELSDDLTYCEDAHCALPVYDPVTNEQKQLYLCIADGVGNWRHYGVDPRLFSHKLVSNAELIIQSDIEQKSMFGQSGGGWGAIEDSTTIHPLDVVFDAWNLTLSEKIPGSSTFCVSSMDLKTGQLSYANLGDGGLLVVRHIDSDVAGYMRERQQPRHLRKNDLKIAYLSQQQLKSFNLPYQLGFWDKSDDFKFETPSDADKATINLLPGDIVIMGTDGLFDNVDLHEIVEEITVWERKWFPNGSADVQKPLPGGVSEQKSAQALAEQLVLKAREYSLDSTRDSPFAVLAKENDILWGGGMPDDTTVLVARVYNPSAK